MYDLILGGFKFLKKCERCGYSGEELDIKKCSINSSIWKKTNICSICYKEIKEEILKEKLAPKKQLKPNAFIKDITLDISNNLQCPYCGSWIEKNADICKHCCFDFKTKKVSMKPRKHPSSFSEGKDFSKIKHVS